MAAPPKDSPDDQEANLFTSAPEHVKRLFTEAKRVRRLADRKAWWARNQKQPSATETVRGEGNLEE